MAQRHPYALGMADAADPSAAAGVITFLWRIPLVLPELLVLAIVGLAIVSAVRLVGPRLGPRVARRPTTFLGCFAGLGVVLSVVLGSLLTGLAVAAVATASIAASTDA